MISSRCEPVPTVKAPPDARAADDAVLDRARTATAWSVSRPRVDIRPSSRRVVKPRSRQSWAWNSMYICCSSGVTSHCATR